MARMLIQLVSEQLSTPGYGHLLVRQGGHR